MSEHSVVPRIIAEQTELLRKRSERLQLEYARDREQATLRNAWDGVRCWLASDCSVRNRDTGVEVSPDVAIAAIARLSNALSQHGLLDQLAEVPTGVQEEDRQAWFVAKKILDDATANPVDAGKLLSQVNGLPFASTVRNWLCSGFRIVIEKR